MIFDARIFEFILGLSQVAPAAKCRIMAVKKAAKLKNK